MSVPPKQEVSIRDFAGMVTNTDPRDIPPESGAGPVVENLDCHIPGQLTVRRGYRVVQFEE